MIVELLEEADEDLTEAALWTANRTTGNHGAVIRQVRD